MYLLIEGDLCFKNWQTIMFPTKALENKSSQNPVLNDEIWKILLVES
jgi:hypothetical protein